MEGLIQWFETQGDKFYQVLIENDRYEAYITGFGRTLLISFFAVILGAVIGTLIAIIKYSAARTKKLGLLAAICNFI